MGLRVNTNVISISAQRNLSAVTGRLEKLAQNLYGEVVLYQNIGDHVKALERIQKILEHAPMTPAAEALREKAVLDS